MCSVEVHGGFPSASRERKDRGLSRKKEVRGIRLGPPGQKVGRQERKSRGDTRWEKETVESALLQLQGDERLHGDSAGHKRPEREETKKRRTSEAEGAKTGRADGIKGVLELHTTSEVQNDRVQKNGAQGKRGGSGRETKEKLPRGA